MRIFLALAVMAFALISPAQAQSDYPNHSVTIIVPFAAGGPSDVVTRILADELSKVWKQQVLVENKAGGGTVIGNNLAARAKPDGYTMLMVAGSFTILPGVHKKLPYDAIKDFSGVTLFVEAPMAIVASPGFEANNLEDLIAKSKTRGDKPFTFASSGVAASSHMAGELLQRKAGIKLRHVPYSGEAANMADTLAGRVDFQIGTWSTTRPYVESGKLKLLSILFKSRLPEAPNTETLNESIKGLQSAVDAFNGIVIPSGVPAEIKAKISEGIKAAVSTDSFKQKILAIGSYPRYATPEETDKFLHGEMATWKQIATEANIHLD
jgi:tripartite-type tricarboxylate transporter receptor subunit TctC